MANFAKLFQVGPLNQVLVTTSYDDDENKDEIIQTTIIEGETYQSMLEFEDEDKAISFFDKYDEDQALTFFNNALDIRNNMTDFEEEEQEQTEEDLEL